MPRPQYVLGTMSPNPTLKNVIAINHIAFKRFACSSSWNLLMTPEREREGENGIHTIIIHCSIERLVGPMSSGSLLRNGSKGTSSRISLVVRSVFVLFSGKLAIFRDYLAFYRRRQRCLTNGNNEDITARSVSLLRYGRVPSLFVLLFNFPLFLRANKSFRQHGSIKQLSWFISTTCCSCWVLSMRFEYWFGVLVDEVAQWTTRASDRLGNYRTILQSKQWESQIELDFPFKMLFQEVCILCRVLLWNESIPLIGSRLNPRDTLTIEKRWIFPTFIQRWESLDPIAFPSQSPERLMLLFRVIQINITSLVATCKTTDSHPYKSIHHESTNGHLVIFTHSFIYAKLRNHSSCFSKSSTHGVTASLSI